VCQGNYCLSTKEDRVIKDDRAPPRRESKSFDWSIDSIPRDRAF